MAATDPPVTTLLTGNTLVVTLNRPGRRNAWNAGMGARYAAALAGADTDPEVRAIVVTGAGDAFCAGADLAEVAVAGSQGPPAGDAEAATRIRKPMIAAVNGAAIGLGLVQALFCDVRFSTPDASFAAPFARLGLVGEYGIAALLAQCVGTGWAADLLLSGRTVLGTEAHRIGLVQYLADRRELLSAALGYAADIAARCAPGSLAVLKQQLRTEPVLQLAESLRRSQHRQLASLSFADAMEGARAFREKRAPSYPPLDQAEADPV